MSRWYGPHGRWGWLLAVGVICGGTSVAQTSVVTPQEFVPGDVAIADGASHPLSTQFQSLNDAKAKYSFVTSLSDEFAWVGWQMALNQAQIKGSVVVDAPAGVYLVHPLHFYSNTTIKGYGYTLRLVFTGKPKTGDVQMLLSPATYSDALTTDFSLSGAELDGNRDHIEWSEVKGDGNGHGIALWGVRGASLQNLVIQNMYTDGIYIVGLRHHFEQESRDLAFRNIRIENCRRQGVTVISGSNLKFTDFVIHDIQGIAPGAAFDFEPNAKIESIQNVAITNLVGDHLRAGILITSLATPTLTDNISLANIWLTDITNTHGLGVRNMTGLHVNDLRIEMSPNVRSYPAVEFGSVRGASVKNIVTRNGFCSICVRSGSYDIDIDGADIAGGRLAGFSVEENTTGILRAHKLVGNGMNSGVQGISIASRSFYVER